MRNPPILISVLGFFAALAGIYYIFAGLRLIGFDFFGAFSNTSLTQGYWFWGVMWIVVGVIYIAVAGALWSLQPWAWLFAEIIAVFGLISAFFVMFDLGLGAALGAALLPAIILLYLNGAEVKAAFGVGPGAGQGGAGGGGGTA
jgi:hypothetical protein